jgi:SAM-dependent methyltransferase
VSRIAYSWIDVPAGTQVQERIPSSAEGFAQSMDYDSTRYATREDLMAHASHRWIAELRAVLREMLDRRRSVLSVGSGKCEHEAPLAEEGFDITASDLQLESVEDARRLVPELKVMQFDALQPSVQHAFDDVLATGIDYAFDDPDLERFLVATRGVVRPGGRLILVHRFQDTPATRVIDRVLLPAWAGFRRLRYRLRGEPMRVVRREHGHRRTRAEVRAAAIRAGWSVGRVRHAGAAMELSRLPLPGQVVEAAARADRRAHLLNIATVLELVQ